MSLKPLYILLSAFLSSCSGYYLTVKSRPEDAVVYIVPKVVWRSDSIRYSNPVNIEGYIVKTSVTPVYTLEVPPGDYMLILINDDKKKIVPISLRKTSTRKKAKVVDVVLS